MYKLLKMDMEHLVNVRKKNFTATDLQEKGFPDEDTKRKILRYQRLKRAKKLPVVKKQEITLLLHKNVAH